MTETTTGLPQPQPRARRPGRKVAADRTPLTRERVLAAALELVDAEGLAALTRRRLASYLDCNAMALYRYAPNEAALLDGIVEQVLSQLDMPSVADTDGADWQTQLRRGAHSFRSLALAHPRVFSLFLTRPMSTPLALRSLTTLRPLETMLELLQANGIGPADSFLTYQLYVGFVYAHIHNELQDVVVDPDETEDLLRLGLNRLPAREFPLLRGLASEMAAYDGKAALDTGLDVLFAGLNRQISRHVKSDATGATDAVGE